MNVRLLDNLRGAFNEIIKRNLSNIITGTELGKMSRPYDIVVYGATGFTGQYAAAEAFRTKGDKKIAIAGRNKTKLMKTLDFIKEENGGEDVHSEVGIIIANNSDNDTILEMCRQCNVVVNCVGPYAFYGEQVVKACVEMGTHHIDISGEPKYLQMCQLKYHDEAKAKGIHIVGTCGFDSIPADIGLETLRERFPGELVSADSFIRPRGAGKANVGTYNSLVQAFGDQKIVAEQNRLLFKERLSYVGPRLKQKIFGWLETENRYFIPFLGPDAGVVKRTQLFESTHYDKTPVSYHAYLTVPSIVHLFFMMLFGLSVFILTKFQLGIKILLRFPGLFSFGTFSTDGVSKKDLERSGFKMIFHGKGYSTKPATTNDAGEPDTTMTLTFIAPEMGYIFTSISMMAAAHTLLEDKLLNVGGVLTPGSAFKGTKFVERLEKRGVKITTS